MAEPTDVDWVPDACTLPTAEQPLRVAEFGELFASAVRDVRRVDPTTLHLRLDRAAHATAQELTERESDCCSFFTFDFLPADDRTVTLTVTVPTAYTAVLDAVADQAAAAPPDCGGSALPSASRWASWKTPADRCTSRDGRRSTSSASASSPRRWR
ncbi:MAG TPA: hypothetical protein VEX15_19620 [Nocardioidaceae bacterium]|nr:hypothetical protein [Nocardioidaceae bacterium]